MSGKTPKVNTKVVTSIDAEERKKRQEVALAKIRADIRNKALERKRAIATAVDAVSTPISAEVGVKERDRMLGFLRVFAKSDFKHDFGEKVPSRDWITFSDRTRFSQLVQKFPVKQRVSMLNMFDNEFPRSADDKVKPVGNNLYGLLNEKIAQNLYPGDPGTSAEFIIEEEILKKVGLEYVELKKSIKDHFEANPGVPFASEMQINIKGVFSRNYRIGAQKYKNQDGATRNLASLFKDVTGGATKFAILVDASLGMSVSKIGDSTLTPDPGAPCNFVVLQNVESDADSATGASSFPETDPTKTTVTLMRDNTTSTVLYPIWQQSDPPSDTEILFSKVQILLNRVEAGDVEASIIVDNESHNIPDVGTTSNVKNASLNALVALYMNKIPGIARGTGDARKPYLYALLKRMGDWCQALSLLDRTRVYTTQTGESATLQDLITGGYEVGLVTNDRILLAYGLVLGLNVYFTTATDVASLVYFKNADDLADEASFASKTEKNMAIFAELAGDASPEAISQTIEGEVAKYTSLVPAEGEPYATFITNLYATIKSSLTTNGVADDGLVNGVVNAFMVKVILSNLGELRTNFREIEADILKSIAVLSATEEPLPTEKEKFIASVNLVNLANKFKLDLQHNESVIARLNSGSFSGTFTSQQNVFVDLAKKLAPGSRLAVSETMARAKEVLLSCRDDIKQVLQKGIMTPEQLNGYIPAIPELADPRPTEKDVANFEVLYGAFDVLRTELQNQAGGKQRGGAIAIANSLLQRVVFPYKSAKLETTVNRLKRSQTPSDVASLSLLDFLPAVQVGSYYRDDKSRPYSVIDRYLITKEDSNVLGTLLYEVFAQPGRNAKVANFSLYRFALLYHDILYERYEHIIDDSNVEGTLSNDLEIEDEEITEGSLLEFSTITNEALLLRVLINRYANGENTANDILNLFSEGVDETLIKKYGGKLTPGEGTFGEDIETNLANVRSVIFAKYEPYMTVDKEEVDIQEKVERILESKADVGGPGFQGGNDASSNATASTGSARRRLYQGLRKRTGSGSPPGV